MLSTNASANVKMNCAVASAASCERARGRRWPERETLLSTCALMGSVMCAVFVDVDGLSRQVDGEEAICARNDDCHTHTSVSRKDWAPFVARP